MVAKRVGNLRFEISPLVRVTGRNRPASLVMKAVDARTDLPIQIRSLASSSDDYTQIDAALHVGDAGEPDELTPPKPGAGYAGFTPQQRRWFLDWLKKPRESAPLAFQQLYVAYLEIGLFEEDDELVGEVLRKLVVLQTAPAWYECMALYRAVQLGLWLTQSAQRYGTALETIGTHDELWGVVLGQLALLGGTLTPAMTTRLLTAWQIGTETPSTELLQLRLTSLSTNLGAEPLAFALAQQNESKLVPHPWRTAHRDIRIALPQPDLRPILEPLLREIIATETELPDEEGERFEPDEFDEDEETTASDIGWHIVLEFGQSRSEFFDYTLHQARKQPGFSQLLDENRKIVYRVLFRKRDQRTFWRLWEYVKNWSETRVYVNGNEVKKWDVYPYSPHMR